MGKTTSLGRKKIVHRRRLACRRVTMTKVYSIFRHAIDLKVEDPHASTNSRGASSYVIYLKHIFDGSASWNMVSNGDALRSYTMPFENSIYVNDNSKSKHRGLMT